MIVGIIPLNKYFFYRWNNSTFVNLQSKSKLDDKVEHVFSEISTRNYGTTNQDLNLN